MADEIAHRLYIKYGLASYPSIVQIGDWTNSVRDYVQTGMEVELAGRRGAVDIFGGVDVVLRFSEADTIQALLAIASKKD